MLQWPALPFWDLVQKLDLQLRQISVDGRLRRTTCRSIRDAFVAKYIDSVSGIAFSVLVDFALRRGYSLANQKALWVSGIETEFSLAHPEKLVVLRERCGELAKVFLHAARQLAERLETPPAVVPETISHMRVLGDLHLRGAVVLLYENGEPSIVYKPRSLEIDVALENVLALLRRQKPDGQFPSHPLSIDCGDYGFQEYIGYSSPCRGKERETYFKKYGSLIAIAYALNMTDLHRENIKCTSSSPVIVDAECTLNFAPSELSIWDSEAASLLYPQETVLSSVLLPNWKVQFDSAGAFDVTALGSYRHPDRQSSTPHFYINDGGEMKVDYRRVDVAHLQFPNHPDHDDREFPVSGYEECVLEGFRSTYRLFLDPKLRHEIIGIFRKCEHATSRFIASNTAEYVTRLQTPQYFTKASSRASHLSAWIADVENFAMNKGVVPLIERSINSSVVMSDDGTRFELPDTPLDRFAHRISSMTEEDLAAQTRLVEIGLSIGGCNPGEEEKRVLFGSRPAPDVDGAIAGLVNELSTGLVSIPSGLWLPVVEELENNFWCMKPATTALYDGMAGVAFSLGLAGIDSAKARDAYLQFQERMMSGVEGALNIDDPIARANCFTSLTGVGILGPLLVIARIASLTGDKNTLKWVTSVGNRLPHVSEEGSSWDLMAGLAGVAIGLRELAMLVESDQYRSHYMDAVNLLGERMGKAAQSGELKAGLAHGLSGVAAALVPGMIQDGIAHSDLILGCFEAEEHLLADNSKVDERALSSTWCWGSTGQLYARLAGGYENEEVLNKLRGQSRKVADGYRNLCHGSLSQALLLSSSSYTDRYGIADGKKLGQFVTSQLIENVTAHPYAPSFIKDIGLFTGASGVLSYLCAVRDGATFDLATLQYV